MKVIIILWKSRKINKSGWKFVKGATNTSPTTPTRKKSTRKITSNVISSFIQVTQLIGQAGLKVLRNAVPKYFKKASDTKASTKRYVDTNTGKIVEFPTKGCFEVYYKSILVFSKLQNSAFPDLSFLCLILKLIRSFC